MGGQFLKESENVKFDSFAYLRTSSYHVTPKEVGSRSGVNMHHPQTAMAGDTRGAKGVLLIFVGFGGAWW